MMQRGLNPPLLILGTFGVMVSVLVVSASTPYVPAPQTFFNLSIGCSALTFIGLLVASALWRGSDREPRGFRWIASVWSHGERGQVAKVILVFPAASALLGSFIAAVLVSAPSYPTALLSTDKSSTSATCMYSGRDKVRGAWSLFRLPSGEEWKVAGRGSLCPKVSRAGEHGDM